MIFLFLGYVYSVDKPNGDDVLIYKIGDYANFTKVNSFINENISPPIQSIEPKDNQDNHNPSNNRGVIIGATIGGILGIIILGFIIGYKIFRRHKPIIRIR